MAAFTFASRHWRFSGKAPKRVRSVWNCRRVFFLLLLLFACLFSRKKRATRLSFACQHTLPIGGEVQLTRLVVVLLLRHSSGGLSSGEDPSPSPRPQPCARVSGRGMASAGRGWQRFKTAAPSLWALLFSRVDARGWWWWWILYLLSQPFLFCLLPVLISS